MLIRNILTLWRASATFCHVKVKKATKLATPQEDPKTKGTIWAEQNRSRCNKLTDAEREKLMARALEVIYAGKAPARRG